MGLGPVTDSLFGAGGGSSTAALLSANVRSAVRRYWKHQWAGPHDLTCDPLPGSNSAGRPFRHRGVGKLLACGGLLGAWLRWRGSGITPLFLWCGRTRHCVVEPRAARARTTTNSWSPTATTTPGTDGSSISIPTGRAVITAPNRTFRFTSHGNRERPDVASKDDRASPSGREDIAGAPPSTHSSA